MRTRAGRSTAPLVGRIHPEPRASSVVLPQPDGPTSDTNSPWRTSKLIPLNTSTSPNAWPTRSKRSSGGEDGVIARTPTARSEFG